MSGTGTLFKSLYGTLTLTGTHSHLGGTVVDQGRLIDLNPTGDYVTNADLEFRSEGDIDFRNAAQRRAYAIAGSGNFTKSGAGALFLSSANNYRGGTTVAGGALVARVDNALPGTTALAVDAGTFILSDNRRQTVAALSGGGSVQLGTGSALTIGGAADSTFSGGIDGLGSLTKSGTGTLTLTGLNTYQSGTTVGGGRLVDANPHGDYAVASGASLELRTASDSAYAGKTVGAGSLTKSGPGALTLSGENAYTGGTRVSEGRLVDLAPHGDYGVATGAVLEFPKATDSTYSGIVEGTGTFVKSGAGSLTLAGSLKQGLDVRIAGGTLKVAGGTVYGDVVGAAGATFQFDADAPSFAGRYSGAGALLKTGRRELTLAQAPANAGGLRWRAAPWACSGRGPSAAASRSTRARGSRTRPGAR